MLNYFSYLKNGGEDILKKYDDLKSYYFCQKCNRQASALCIYQLEALGNITENCSWICDKCITEWRRNGTKIDPTDEYLIRHEWDVKFLEKLGIGGDKLLSAKRYAVKNIKHRYKDILLNLPREPGLANEKQKIEDKYGNPSIIQKNRIRANNKEETTVSNIPANCQVFIDGQKVAENTNTLIFNTFNKGKYKLKITSDYHLDFEGDIDAY